MITSYNNLKQRQSQGRIGHDLVPDDPAASVLITPALAGRIAGLSPYWTRVALFGDGQSPPRIRPVRLAGRTRVRLADALALREGGGS